MKSWRTAPTVTFPVASITATWPVPNHAARWQRHIRVNNLPGDRWVIIIIIIMTRRQLWSVATLTLHDVHVPLRSATFVSSWTEFPRRPAVSMSFWDVQGVFASSCPDRCVASPNRYITESRSIGGAQRGRRTGVGSDGKAGRVLQYDVDARSICSPVDDLRSVEVVEGAVAWRLDPAGRHLRLVLLKADGRTSQHQPTLVPLLHTATRKRTQQTTTPLHASTTLNTRLIKELIDWLIDWLIDSSYLPRLRVRERSNRCLKR